MSDTDSPLQPTQQVDGAPPVRAAQYIRMSTEHQQYSTANQADIIREYAVARGYEIVRTYADHGKSGLRVEGRDALKELLEDVRSGTADFEAILVYDISRWGRFQDSDESAYYEYVCKRAGLCVEYCAEQFENDGSPVSTIIKGVKRAMAGEYSRELSAKVFKGQCRLIQLGYRQGGPAGFGLRRALINQTGDAKTILRKGEHKSLQTDRVVLVPGPDTELAIVREVYRRFIHEGHAERQIAEWLNEQRAPLEDEGSWTKARVHTILTNEKYIGNNVWNKVSFKLKRRRVRNPPDLLVRADGTFPAIIDPESFFTARGIIRERTRRFTDDEMIERLARVLRTHGYLSGALIDDADGLPSSTAYRSRFGGLVQAYHLAGYTPDRNMEYIAINRRIRAAHPQLLEDIIQDLESVGADVQYRENEELLQINRMFTASLLLSRCRHTESQSARWLVRVPPRPRADVIILVRMDPANEQASDYYLLPRIGIDLQRLVLHQNNGAKIDAFRFETLEFFRGMALCHVIGTAA